GAMARSFGVSVVGKTLNPGVIALAVLEGAPRDLAGLPQPAALDAADGLERGLHHGTAGVDLQLGHVLAGLALGRGEPEGQSVVNDLTGLWVLDAAQGRKSRARPRRGHFFQHAAGGRP